MKELNSIYPNDKKECYELLYSQLQSLFEGENHLIPNLSNTSAILGEALKDINWVGFYLMVHNQLLLGPFQGRVACTRIPVGKGVCGTAVLNKETQLVPDVHAFPGHIACDSASNSEIVIPILHNEEVVAVLDIDSPMFSRFDEADKQGLERIVQLLETSCDWNSYF